MAQPEPRWITYAEAENEFGGGGGSGFAYQGTVTLSNAQILTLPTTAVTVVAAQGANILIVPISGTVLANIAVGYVGAEQGSWSLMIGGAYMSSPMLAGALIAGVHNGFQSIPMPFLQDGTGDFAGAVITSFATSYAIENLTNQPLKIKDDWDGLSDYTGGDAANSAIVSIEYRKLNVITGVFV